MTLTVVLIAVLFGALIGSFSNVVIHRLPAGTSIVHPGSSCPRCGRRLGPLELVPVVSWLVQRGRCRGCGTAIAARYPLVETLVAVGFGLMAWRWSPLDHPVAFAFLAAWWTLLVIATFIDLDRFEIPDVLTLPGLAVGLVAAFAWQGAPDLPGFAGAAFGAALGAGVLTLVNRIGALVLRRFRDTSERLWPIGFDQANLAALVGAAGGLVAGLSAAAASVLLNLFARRTVRLPEPLAWAGWAVAVAASPLGVGVVRSLGGSLAAAGAAALAGAVVWWTYDLTTGRSAAESDAAPEGRPTEPQGDDEPVAMGFGDVKLAALLGVVLGWERLLVGVFAAVLIGAVVGVAQRIAGGGRVVPFGPFLALGGALALFFGDAVLAAYLGALGVS
ncbi:MAG: prepilin peptidase [Trueperaceae bacterium]|nr:prepilin peptidase [Trueperaceae bacterium]